jgi:hypothetical protein
LPAEASHARGVNRETGEDTAASSVSQAGDRKGCGKDDKDSRDIKDKKDRTASMSFVLVVLAVLWVLRPFLPRCYAVLGLRSSITAWLRRKLRKGSFGGIIIPQLEDTTMFEETAVRWAKGVRVEAMRSMLLNQLRKRFGRVPAGTRRALETIKSERELQRLAGRVLVASSLAELGL